MIWCKQTGQWPEGDIDHVNRVRDDNRFVNLRECTGVKIWPTAEPTRMAPVA